jgi:DNA-binding transcriptional MerR regulator
MEFDDPSSTTGETSMSSAQTTGPAHFDDDDYPAYTMGRAAEMLGTTPGFLRSLDEAKLITPQRSEGGHRRYSRYQLRLAARARELVDQGTALEAACRIIILEDQLAEALRINDEMRERHEQSPLN